MESIVDREKGRAVPGEASSNSCWESVVQRHDGRLRRRVRRELSRIGLRARYELVEDVVQDVYCRLLASGSPRLRRWQGPGFDAYLGRTAERAVLDHVRTASAAKRGGFGKVRIGRWTRRRLESLGDPGPTPEEAALHGELRRLFLHRCRRVQGLGPASRNAWIMNLAVLEGWTSREISQATGGQMTPRSIDCLVHRIRRRLAREGFDLKRR
ncbi:MAG TPA: sigma-70 family RNA polymerase sigma factor [Thermoanaerobaculia bacterium]